MLTITAGLLTKNKARQFSRGYRDRQRKTLRFDEQRDRI